MKIRANKYVLTLILIVSVVFIFNILYYFTFFETELPKRSGILNLGPAYLEWCINRYR